MNTSIEKNTDQQAAFPGLSPLGRRIVEIRNRRGWSQRALAHRTGLLPSRLSKLERALKPPKLDELVRLSLALEAGLDELVFGEPPRTRTLQLVRELEALGTPEEIAGLARLLQLVLAGYRVADGPRPEGDRT
jgi:transcriptional regulator with XRE-family HTH domain